MHYDAAQALTVPGPLEEAVGPCDDSLITATIVYCHICCVHPRSLRAVARLFLTSRSPW